MTHNEELRAPAPQAATARVNDGILADGWFAPPVAIPILMTALIVITALWRL
jgi:hypothetical protein